MAASAPAGRITGFGGWGSVRASATVPSCWNFIHELYHHVFTAGAVVTKLIGISGNLRRGSFNTALLRAAAEFVPDGRRPDRLAHRDSTLEGAGRTPAECGRDDLRKPLHHRAGHHRHTWSGPRFFGSDEV
jgi:hypothetical protein